MGERAAGHPRYVESHLLKDTLCLSFARRSYSYRRLHINPLSRFHRAAGISEQSAILVTYGIVFCFLFCHILSHRKVDDARPREYKGMSNGEFYIQFQRTRMLPSKNVHRIKLWQVRMRCCHTTGEQWRVLVTNKVHET